MIGEPFVEAFVRVALSPDPDLAVAALMIARLEYRHLDAGRYLDFLDELGREAAERLDAASRIPYAAPHFADPMTLARVTALSEYLFQEQRFAGNQADYDNPRNSFLNEVLDRRTGIPITLALVYMEVARRAGLHVEGINFPGHFLVRCPGPRQRLDGDSPLIIDAFHGGALLSEQACRDLLRRHTGDDGGEELRLSRATKPQILARMLVNLKRTYIRMNSFPQARDISELLVALNPASSQEIRDRGLLAYQMQDFGAALRDLQAYLDTSPDGDVNDLAQLREHVHTLKRQMAGLN
jgi:regulator of sirC expression with transglutaminase-like and TPR domain